MNSNDDYEYMSQNPGLWATVISCYVYLQPLIRILQVLNSSVNFFAYRILLGKEKKLHKKRKTLFYVNLKPTNSTAKTDETKVSMGSSLD